MQSILHQLLLNLKIQTTISEIKMLQLKKNSMQTKAEKWRNKQKVIWDL